MRPYTPSWGLGIVDVWSMTEYHGKLYAGTQNFLGSAQVWTNDGTTWTNVSPSWGSSVYSAMSMTVYGENLYVGTAGAGAAQVWSNLVIVVPTVTTTSPITGITSTAATGGGNVTADGGASVTARGVCWGTSTSPTTPCTTDGSGTGVFVSSLTGLTPNTPYYVRAYATNPAGTAYGNDVQFTTAAGPAASIVASGGTPQSATVSTAFAQPLRVTVTDSFGNPVVSAVVTFSAPTSGPSASLSNGGSATTDANGHASVTATANAIAGGPYLVSAVTGTLPAVTFSLTNLEGASNQIPTLGGVGLLGFAVLILAAGAIVLARTLTAGHP